MNICISIGHGKSAKGGYDRGALESRKRGDRKWL